MPSVPSWGNEDISFAEAMTARQLATADAEEGEEDDSDSGSIIVDVVVDEEGSARLNEVLNKARINRVLNVD